MKRSLTAPSRAQQAKRDKLQRFKQLPTSWWSALRGYLKKLKRATRKSSASCQTPVRPPPHQSAPIRSHNQKIYPKQQLWQRLQGPSTDSNSTLEANITPSFFQPSVNFSLRRSPAIPAGWYSFTRRGFTTLSINHQNPKVSHISFRGTDINSLFRSLQPLPLMIPTCAIACSFSPLPESQHNQKQAALVYPQINHLLTLPPIIEIDRPPPPWNTDWQWPANKPQVIYPTVEITNPSPTKPAAAAEISEKKIQKPSLSTGCREFEFLKTSDLFYKSRKRSNPYSHLALTEEPLKKRAKTVSCSEPKKLTIIEAKSDKQTQGSSQNIILKRVVVFDTSKNESKELRKCQRSRKCCHLDSGSELVEEPYNPCLDEAETPLNKPENNIVHSFLERANFSLTKPISAETEPEKQIRKTSSNTKVKRRNNLNIMDTFYVSRKRKNSYCTYLEELPKKRAGLESNLTPGEAKTSLIEPENKGIYPFVEVTNASPEGSAVKETESKKPTQKKLQVNRFKETVFFKTSKNKYQESSQCCHPDAGSELAEPPKKPATLASIPDPDEIGTSLIESKNKDKQSIECDDYRVETTTEKSDSSTEKGSGSELSNSDPSETETATEDEDAWCYRLAAYGYDTQRYPLLTQLPDDCHWGKRIIRDFEPEDIFWLDFEEKSLLYGARQCAVLTEFFQIDPLTYQHPYLEQSINAYTTPSESLSSPTQVDSCSPADSTFKNINLTDSLLIGGS